MSALEKQSSSTNQKQTTLLDTFDPRKIKRELQQLRPHPEIGRLIDSYPGTRTIPMRVLCLGQSRTGTMALFTALQQLDYKPYHMAVALGSPKINLALWTEALEAKYHGKGKPWGRDEFDKLLGNYDAVTDVPAICFMEELVAAYPDARVVVGSRDVDSWLQSMGNTAGRVLSWNGWGLLSKFDHALAGPFWAFANTIMPIHFRTLSNFSPESPARQAFFDYYELLDKAVPEDKRLDFQVQQGWEPLCEYLEVPVPDHEFPRLNDASQFVFAHGMMWWLAFGKMVSQTVVPAAVIVGGLIIARRMK